MRKLTAMAEARIRPPLLASLAVALPIATAQAQGTPGSATASLTDFRITATDLRPDDGIAAQWSLISNADSPPPPPETWYQLPDTSRDVGVRRGDDVRSTVERDLTFMPAADLQQVTAWGSGTLASDGSNITAHAQLLQSEASARSRYRSTGMILVGAHTSLTFSGVLGVNVECGTGCRLSTAFSQLELRTYPLGSFNWSYSRPYGQEYYGPALYFTSSGSDSRSIPVEVVFSNDSDSEAQISSQVFLWAAVNAVTPVPEPATAASLLAGLALVAWRRRRDRAVLNARDQNCSRAPIQAARGAPDPTNWA
jgi:hypothetical protein